jgi:endonuclease/exonuclease/phosphatase family metal-dependent hydrolase
MKLISLNIWGGIVYNPLMDFIKKHSTDTDIFCFQEMLFGEEPKHTPIYNARENLFNEIKQQLKEFTAYDYISPSKYFQDEQIEFKAGQVIFVRNTIKVIGNGEFRSYDNLPIDTEKGGALTGNFQWIDLEINNEVITIANLHGLWQKGTSKIDTAERLFQSNKIKDLFKTKNNKKILCGDFNLSNNGKSIEILEDGMINLIKLNDIKSTRSDLYKKDVRLGDYILVSPDVEVKDFQVIQNEVSDHLPLLLEFK